MVRGSNKIDIRQARDYACENEMYMTERRISKLLPAIRSVILFERERDDGKATDDIEHWAQILPLAQGQFNQRPA